MFNERNVARRLVEACAAIDYPADRFEIQVLDDSTDETVEIVAAAVGRLGTQLPDGPQIMHLHRKDRTGFKAGALAAGLETARGELVAVFDADFIPPTDFLKRTVGEFVDPSVCVVQGRWTHLNDDYNALTDIQAFLLDAHFLIEHSVRERHGWFFNFNGTAGILRRAAIVDAGGWTHDTITEDLDLSYRMQLRGWRLAYRPEVACPAELPVEMSAFLKQQYRWTKGTMQTARKLLRRVLTKAGLPLTTRIEACFHLCAHTAFPALLALMLISLPTQLCRLMWPTGEGGSPPASAMPRCCSGWRACWSTSRSPGSCSAVMAAADRSFGSPSPLRSVQAWR